MDDLSQNFRQMAHESATADLKRLEKIAPPPDPAEEWEIHPDEEATFRKMVDPAWSDPVAVAPGEIMEPISERKVG